MSLTILIFDRIHRRLQSPPPTTFLWQPCASDSFDILSQTPYLIYMRISVYSNMKVISSEEECHHSNDRDYWTVQCAGLRYEWSCLSKSFVLKRLAETDSNKVAFRQIKQHYRLLQNNYILLVFITLGLHNTLLISVVILSISLLISQNPAVWERKHGPVIHCDSS